MSQTNLWLLMLALATACGCARAPNDRTADGRIIVQYWMGWTGFEADAMQAVADDFNASQNRIHVSTLMGQNDSKLLLATSGGNPPDISDLFSSNIRVYAEKNALLPLNRMLKEAGIERENYIPVFWDMNCHHGFVWALPSTPMTLALHWNKKLFREAGLDPERPPRSLAELIAMSEKLTIVEIKRGREAGRVRYTDLTDGEKAAKDFRLIQVGHLPQDPGWMCMWNSWFGGSWIDGDRRITALTPENVKDYAWLRSTAEKYGVANLRGWATLSRNSAVQNSFQAGRVAMAMDGVWAYNFIRRYAPQLEWGVAPFPTSDPAKFPTMTVAMSNVLVIPKGARHPREAFEFMRYVNTRGPMEKLAIGQLKFSPLARTSDDFYARHPNPFIKVYLELARSPDVRVEPSISIWPAYGDELRFAADRVMALDATPEEALADVQKRMQPKLDRFLRRWDLVKEARFQEWSRL